MADETRKERAEIFNDRPTPTAAATTEPAWEMIEHGRYQPRRFRGSFRGRELG